MTGWMLEAYNKGQNTIWVRNPYYWCIDKEGNQLPYMDGLTMTNVQDNQVFRLRVSEGQVDYVHGNFSPLNLADVQTLRANEAKSKLKVWFWDGGGGGNTYFFNYDYKDEKYRKWFREPKFLKALSIATNRSEIQKVVDYGTGELTTGTMSPKALEFNVAGGKEVYQAWRDSAKEYNPDKAKAELDALGFKDVNSDGWREFPDGSKFQVTLDYSADQDPAGPALKRIELWTKHWQAVGIDTKPNPIPPASRDEIWGKGEMMNRADWGVGDGPNCLVFPQWLVPMEATRWAPLEGKMYEVRGTPAFDQQKDLDPFARTPPRMEATPGGPVEKLWSLYDQTKIEPDPVKRTKLVWDIVKIHIDHGPFFTAATANTPTLVVVKDGMKNVPQKEDLAQGGFTGPWIIPAPAVYDPEAYFWDNPDQHKRA
jgi:peptide/nickel transport system substrate-binding protein